MRTSLCAVALAAALMVGVALAAPRPVLRLVIKDTVSAVDAKGATAPGVQSRGVEIVDGPRGKAARFSIHRLSRVTLPGRFLNRDQGAVTLRVRLRHPSSMNLKRTLLNVGGGQGSTVALEDNRVSWIVRSPKLNWKAETWHHVALCWGPNGADPDMPFRYDVALYVDGKGVALWSANRRPVSGGAITLGCFPVPVYGKPQLYELEGDLDEFALYDRPLSPREVARAVGVKAQAPPRETFDARDYRPGKRAPAVPASGPGLKIGKDNPAVIVLSRKCSADDRLAARGLANYVRKMTGYPIKTVRPRVVAPRTRAVVVGGQTPVVIGARTAAEMGLRLPKDFARDELLIRCDGRLAVLAGSKEQGSLHAVYELLERNGVRWYAPGEQGERVPKRPWLFVAKGEWRDRPYSIMRFLGPSGPWAPGTRKLLRPWKRRNRVETGGYSASHRMVSPRLAKILPETLFEKHPEYFGMDVHGRRGPPSRNNLNPCTTHPAVLRAIRAKAVELLKKTAWADYFGIEPIDGGGWCQCPRCKALDAVPENYTDRVCVLANQVAETVEAAFPGKGKGARFFAYQGYMYPPERVRLRGNVQVELTRGFPEMMAAWSGRCTNLQRWDYNGWKTFKWGPMPLSCLAQKARLQTRYGFRGGWMDEEVASMLYMGQPFPYLMAKLMWDPSRDVNVILDDFFTGYYGKAAAPMRKCFDLIEDATRRNQSSGERFVEHRNGIRFKPVNYPPSLWKQCYGWVAEAEKLAAGDPWSLRHVEVAKMTYLYADVARDAQRAEDYADAPRHPFWKYVTARGKENGPKLLEAMRIGVKYDLQVVRGNAEPPTPEAILAMWAPKLRIDIAPYRRLLSKGTPADQEPKGGEWKLAFSDDFERAELGPNWRVAHGNFRIVKGHLVGRGYGLFINRKFPRDQRLEYETWVEKGQTPCDLDALLSVSRLKKWRGGDGYLFQFGGWGNTVNAVLKGKTRVFKGGSPHIVPGKRHRVVCEKSGRRLRWTIDGKLVFEYADPFAPLAGPHVGFLIDTVGQVDNVKVYVRE